MSVDTAPHHAEGTLADDLVHLVDVIEEDVLLIRHVFQRLEPGSQLGGRSLGSLQKGVLNMSF